MQQNKTFLNAMMALGNLGHNFKTYPSEFKEKERGYFKCRHDKVLKGQNVFVIASHSRIGRTTEASYRVGRRGDWMKKRWTEG